MTTASEMLGAYIEAEKAILAGKTISFQGRTMGMEDLESVRKGRQEWEARVAREADASASRPTFGGCRVSVARFGS